MSIESRKNREIGEIRGCFRAYPAIVPGPEEETSLPPVARPEDANVRIPGGPEVRIGTFCMARW